jgi:hypothetical protein
MDSTNSSGPQTTGNHPSKGREHLQSKLSQASGGSKLDIISKMR